MMRSISVRIMAGVLMACAWSSEAWAKTVTVPKARIRIAQLHEELLSRFPQWRGQPQTDGSFSNPPLRVEHDDQQIMLTVPEEADERAIRAVVDAHVPQADQRATAAVASSAALEERVRQIEDRLQRTGL